MFTLRPYQEKIKAGCSKGFKKGFKRQMMILPTGGGKTVTFVDMCFEVVKKGMTAMIMCDRKELIGQARDRVVELGLNPTVIAPGYRFQENNIYLASAQTLVRRDLPKVDLIIVDEAHKQIFDKLLLKYIDYCDPYILGATATPKRSGPQNSLDKVYQNMVEGPKIQELIDLGFLVNATTYAAKEDFSDIQKKGADFDNGALFEKFDKTSLYDGMVDNYNRFAKNKKAICFNVNVEHSINSMNAFLDAGISAEHLDGSTPDKKRREILRDFKDGKFKVLCNCSVLTTGYDEPTIEAVIVNRATLSLPLWLQMCGRGSRTCKEIGKDDFIIIDQGANVYRHGLWEEEREWSLKKKKTMEGVAPVKKCQKCEGLVHASARICGLKDQRDENKVCGYEFPISEKEIKKAEFIKIESLKRRGSGTEKKPDPKTCTMQEMQDYAKEKGFKRGWAYHQFKINGRI